MRDLRSGWTTGTCAAAAAKAAAAFLASGRVSREVDLVLPGGERISLPVLFVRPAPPGAEAGVMKDAGDDPDVTHGCTVVAKVRWREGEGIRIVAGEGVGQVTKPGLQAPVGAPAINPVPQRMIRIAVREETDLAADVTISIPGGREIAEKTFNPRLGIVGGLSILGTSGRVLPFSAPALREALRCALDVAAASGITAPAFTPGRIGERGCHRHFKLREEQVILVGNEWGFILDAGLGYAWDRILAVGHAGKLAKLAAGAWDTHSKRSGPAAPFVAGLGREILGRTLPESNTVEGLFEGLDAADRRRLAEGLAQRVADAIAARMNDRFPISVVLIDMASEIVGSWGDLAPWT